MPWNIESNIQERPLRAIPERTGRETLWWAGLARRHFSRCPIL